MKNSNTLHVVVFPWLAMGHLIPFLKISECLARRGHLVSYISTPRNLQRLPKIPQHLGPLIRLVSIPFPKIHNLPDQAESSMDISHMKSQFLKIAFDLLQSPLASFLESTTPKPDWIIYDYASHWMPKLASMAGISKAYFSLFTAATIAFTIPPSLSSSSTLLSKEEEEEEDRSMIKEDLTVVPARIPFETTIRFHPHEVSRHVESSAGIESGTSDIVRFSISIEESDLLLFRTCKEFEPEWLDLVSQLYDKPVIPVGVLPPSPEDEEMGWDENWFKLKDWLDKQSDESVVYVAFGTEASLSKEQVHKLALGLEQSGLPYLWVLRRPPGTSTIKDATEMLPDGWFESKDRCRGVVLTEWVPQVKILRHPAIGGFLTHCGWNSVVEALSFGRVLILFPIMNDQGLNSRLLQEKKVGLEIARNVKDGSFTAEAVAETLRFAVVSANGEQLRNNAKGMRSFLGDTDRNRSYIDSFVSYLAEKIHPVQGHLKYPSRSRPS